MASASPFAETAITFCFEVLTDIAFVPPLLIMHRYRRHFECALRSFAMPAGSARTAEKTNGVSDHFLLWSRFGPRTQLDGSYLHGTRERERADKLQQKYYYPFCTQHNASVLAAGVLSTAPRHMRSDVDRVVFGRDMDASEAAEVADGQGSNWDKGKLEAPAAASDAPPANALLERLQKYDSPTVCNAKRIDKIRLSVRQKSIEFASVVMPLSPCG